MECLGRVARDELPKTSSSAFTSSFGVDLLHLQLKAPTSDEGVPALLPEIRWATEEVHGTGQPTPWDWRIIPFGWMMVDE